MSQSPRYQQNRSKILSAAAKVIAKHGFHRMSMRKLAQARSSGLATFYNYFSSKEAVLFELQQKAFQSLIELAQNSLSSVHDVKQRLWVFVENHVQYFFSNPEVMQLLVREANSLPAPWYEEIKVLKETYFALAREIVRPISLQSGLHLNSSGNSLKNESELERATYSLFGMLNWVYGWYEPDRHGEPQEVAASIYRLALHGLCGTRDCVDTLYPLGSNRSEMKPTKKSEED